MWGHYLKEIKKIKEDPMNNCMPANWITYMKWTNCWTHSLPKLTQEQIENMNRPVNRLN